MTRLLSLVAVCALVPHLLAADAEKIRYAAIGDSYSSGEGASPAECWPALLAAHLTKSGHPTELVANPSRTGWTTMDALDEELPVFVAARPTFATLQIGVNDWVRGIPAPEFRARLARLLNGMLEVLPDKSRLLVVTIPDFSVTPAGASFANGRDIAGGLTVFNGIIREEAGQRGLTVVDVFPLSQEVAKDATLVARDGLHPSAREYALWEQMIFPVAEKLLTP